MKNYIGVIEKKNKGVFQINIFEIKNGIRHFANKIKNRDLEKIKADSEFAFDNIRFEGDFK